MKYFRLILATLTLSSALVPSFSQWLQVNAPIETGKNVIEILASNGVYIYAGSDRNGLFYSTDGTNWIDMNKGLTLIGCIDMVVENYNIYRITYGILKSTDNGLTWIEVFSPGINEYINTLFVRENIIFAGTVGFMRGGGEEGGVYRSIDSGKT